MPWYQCLRSLPRYFHRALVLLCVVFAFGIASLPANAQEASEANPEILYRQAVTSLERGLRYEQAIKNLHAACEKDPKNYRYPLALGCANISRALSYLMALEYERADSNNHTMYAQWQKQWEDAQNDPKNRAYGMPAPPLPPMRCTADDKQTFSLTYKETAVRVTELAKAALQAWDKAAILAQTDAEKADVESARGWGLAFVRPKMRYWNRTPGKWEPLLLEPDLEKSFEDEAILRAFHKATELQPENALYWRARGDAIEEAYDSLAVRQSESPQVIEAYRTSLRLNPKQSALCYKLYEVWREEKPEEARAYLEAALRYDSQNGTYHAALFLEEILDGAKATDLPPNELSQRVERACRKLGDPVTFKLNVPYLPAVHPLLAYFRATPSEFDRYSALCPHGSILGDVTYKQGDSLLERLQAGGKIATLERLAERFFTLYDYWNSLTKKEDPSSFVAMYLRFGGDAARLAGINALIAARKSANDARGADALQDRFLNLLREEQEASVATWKREKTTPSYEYQTVNWDGSFEVRFSL